MLESIDTSSPYGSTLEYWKDHLLRTHESYSAFLNDLRRIKAENYIGQGFSYSDAFSIWNRLSEFTNLQQELKICEVEIRIILFDWTFSKLSKGKAKPS